MQDIRVLTLVRKTGNCFRWLVHNDNTYLQDLSVDAPHKPPSSSSTGDEPDTKTRIPPEPLDSPPTQRTEAEQRAHARRMRGLQKSWAKSRKSSDRAKKGWQTRLAKAFIAAPTGQAAQVWTLYFLLAEGAIYRLRKRWHPIAKSMSPTSEGRPRSLPFISYLKYQDAPVLCF